MDGVLSDRLRFRRPTMDDREWWMGYMNSEDAIRFMPFTVGSEADCMAFIQRSLDRIARDGSCLNVVSDRTNDRPLGMVGLLTQEVDSEAELEIGYHLLPSAWGHGYATEAAIACREFARSNKLAPSVISLIDAQNHKSLAIAMRNGMMMDKRTVHRGTDVLVYRIKLMHAG